MTQSGNLTYSSVFTDSSNFTIPKQVLEKLSELTKTGKILSIYATNARAIYFFPVTSTVYKVNIAIYPLTPEIVAKIMTKISEFANKVIYSTGLCLIENKCFWEGFFASKDLIKPLGEIEEILTAIPEVNDITILEVDTN